MVETAVQYGSFAEQRPRLTVVHDAGASYSALPHGVLFDARLSFGARLLYAVLQSHWWQGGECFARHDVLAAEMGQGGTPISGRQLRRYLDELIAAEHITESRKGHGQAKTYTPRQPDTGVQSNQTPVSTYDTNQTPVSYQQDTHVQFNQTPVSTPYKKNSSKKKHEEELATTLLDAANAAPAETAELKVKPESRAKRLPEDWMLTPAHITAAERKGLDAARAAVEAEKFCDYHRAKGTRMLDWMAAWRTWLGNAVTFDARRSQPYRNAADPKPPTRDIVSAWAGWKGRHGSNLDALRSRDDGR